MEGNLLKSVQTMVERFQNGRELAVFSQKNV